MKIAIISSKDFQPVYMVKNYIDFITMAYRPFAGYDPEYNEPITFITGLNTLVDCVASVKSSVGGFDVETISPDIEPDEFKRNKLLVEDSDIVAVFWNGENGIVKDTIQYALDSKRDLEVYFDNKEE